MADKIYPLQHTAEEIDHKLNLIDINKNFLSYPYSYDSLKGWFIDVGDGSLLTNNISNITGSNALFLTDTLSLPVNKYIVSLNVTNILEQVDDTDFVLNVQPNGVSTTYQARVGEPCILNIENEEDGIGVTIFIEVPVEEEIEAGLLIKPQIEICPNGINSVEDLESIGWEYKWVPNMDKIGTYVDRRFNGTNAKIKVLDDNITKLLDCIEITEE